MGNEPRLILAALVTVYIVLGILYESYIHPLTILSTLPSAGVGALLALMLFSTEFSVIALIGIILLIGIVKKNAIMMIDFALDAERKDGKPPDEAIYEACLLRFRPIMMTTMAALLGALPLGDRVRRGFGVAASARHCHRRRADPESGADALYDACRLSGVRPVGRARSSDAPAHVERREAPLDQRLGMNISAPFIHRPVATTLLTIGVTLVGLVAFRFLPVAAAASGGVSDHQCSAPPSRREPRNHGVFGGGSARASIYTHRGRHGDDLHEHARSARNITLQFDLNRDIDGAARDVQAAIKRPRADLPCEPCRATRLSEGESGRCAHSDSRR